MTLTDAIAAAGMTPPRNLVSGKWLRFPGIGKGSSNTAGWCRIITPHFARFGDWSTGLKATWCDESVVDSATSKRLLNEALRREREFAARTRMQQERAAQRAARIVGESVPQYHAYLKRKGFPTLIGLVHQGDPVVPKGKEIFGAQLVIPIRDAETYKRIISAQLIDERGEKVFLPGARTQRGIYRIGVEPKEAKRVALCEGYCTALSIHAALQRLPGPHAVIACFSANNLEIVAENFPQAFIAADNDQSKAGEEAAKRTGLPWVMPPDEGDDFNDLMLRHGLHAVTEVLRALQ